MLVSIAAILHPSYQALNVLNSDGTPQRFINAFMIFESRRRPQVSAANQTMRSVDISKILSKEWDSMDMVNDLTVLYRTFLLTDAFQGGQAALYRSS